MIDAGIATFVALCAFIFTIGLVGWVRPQQPVRVSGRIKGRRVAP